MYVGMYVHGCGVLMYVCTYVSIQTYVHILHMSCIQYMFVLLLMSSQSTAFGLMSYTVYVCVDPPTPLIQHKTDIPNCGRLERFHCTVELDSKCPQRKAKYLRAGNFCIINFHKSK